jgi:ribonuclease G
MGAAIDEVLIESKGDRLRAAVVSNGELIEIMTEAHDGRGAVGSIYLGRVVRRTAALHGAFVDIGLARPALLDLGKQQVEEGDVLPVQITESESGDKAPRVSRRIALEGRFAVLLPGGKGVAVSRRVPAKDRQRFETMGAALRVAGEGLIIRAAAAAAEPEMLARDVAALRTVWTQIREAAASATAPAVLLEDDGATRLLQRCLGASAPRFACADRALALRLRAVAERRFGLSLEVEVEADAGRLFDRHGIGDALASAESPTVPLPSGGRITIESTAALTAIDVDVAQAAELGAGAALKTDLEAAAEIARQLRVRDLGGLIVVDFVRLADRAQRAKLAAVLTRAVARDPKPVQTLGWTAGGLFELIRPRARAVSASE